MIVPPELICFQAYWWPLRLSSVELEHYKHVVVVAAAGTAAAAGEAVDGTAGTLALYDTAAAVGRGSFAAGKGRKTVSMLAKVEWRLWWPRKMV